MGSIKELKIKIASLKNTRKITKAMKMIAATKLRKAQLAVIASKPYDNALKRILSQTLSVADNESPLTKKRNQVKKIHLLIFTSDRGLCGGFNSSILKQVNTFIGEKKNKEILLSFAGKQGYDYFEKKISNTTFYKEAIKRGSYAEVENICNNLQVSFEKEECDEVYFIYNHFKSAVLQIPKIEKLFPYSANQDNVDDSASEFDISFYSSIEHLFIFEPNVQEIFEKVLSETIRFSIYYALLNSLASEHASRMTAMDSATKNAGELIDKYTLQMNRARQAAITTELTEIVSGAESLKG